jgi:hypothetical protein
MYATLTRVKTAAGELKLIDAREPSPVMDEITRRGIDIDQAMVLIVGDTLYHGGDAIHALALMSSRSGVFNRLAYWMFRSKTVSQRLYPMLRAMRNLLLKMLGKEKVNNLGLAGNTRF